MIWSSWTFAKRPDLEGLRELSLFEEVRQEGITDEEIVEIIVIAAVFAYNDILADALKVDVDHMVAQALGR